MIIVTRNLLFELFSTVFSVLNDVAIYSTY